MAFRYPLQSILRLRRSLEKQAEQVLFTIAAQIVRLETELEEVWKAERERKTVGVQELQLGSFGAMLQYFAVCEESGAGRRRALQAMLLAAEQRRLQQLAVYQLARQRREILENVRERQEMAYEVELARREQQNLDESFLLRRFFEQQR